MSCLTPLRHNMMKASFCFISSWLKAASPSWPPLFSQARFLCDISATCCVICAAGAESNNGQNMYITLLNVPFSMSEVRRKDYRHHCILKGNCWFCKSVEACFWWKFHNTLRVALSFDESTSGHWTPTKQIEFPPSSATLGQGQCHVHFASFVRNTGIKMRVQGSIRQFTQHWEEAVCQVLVLLINMAIDWSQRSVVAEAASNTNR